MSDYWSKFRDQRIARRRALQMGAMGGAGLAALVLAGCGSDDSGGSTGGGDTASSSDDVEATPTTGLADSQVLRRRITQQMLPFDPATIFRVNVEEIAFHVYSALTTYDPEDPAVKPDAAQSWEVSPEGTQLTFKLNKGMKWHAGYGELTAEDVVYSYRRILDPATVSAYVPNFELLDSIQAPDAETVVIKLKSPDANFFHQVANYHQGAIVNRRALEALGQDYGFKPVGTGPFVFVSHVPGQEVVLERFPEYFRGPATLQRIHLRRIADAETAAIALQNDEIDILGSITNETTYKRLEADPRIQIRQTEKVGHPSNGLFNANTKPLDDPRVRKAFWHAVDRKAVIESVAPLNGRLWNNIIPGWMPEASQDIAGFDYNPDEAKKLLSAAGATNMPVFKFLHTSATEELQFYIDYWSKVGIRVEFELVDEPTFNTRRVANDYQLSYRGLPSINPDDIMFGYLHSNFFAPKGYNTARYSNPEVDSLLEAARKEFDTPKRNSLYHQAQAKALADAPYMTHNHNRRIDINAKTVSPARANPLTNMMFYPMKMYKKA